MPSTPAPHTKSEWIERIAPALEESMRAVSERITSASSVQAWLHEASFEAAGDVARADLQAQAAAHQRMMDDFEAAFAPLVEAIRELTEGCGRIELHWRPLAPAYSRLYIDFGREYEVDVFSRMRGLGSDELQRMLAMVRDALPRGRPFPNRPNVATALVGYEGTCVGLRIEDHLDEDGRRWQRIALLPPGRPPLENLDEDEAARKLRGVFAQSRPDEG